MSIKKATHNFTPEVLQKLAEIAQARGNIKPSGGINQSLTLRQLIEEAWEKEVSGEEQWLEQIIELGELKLKIILPIRFKEACKHLQMFVV